MPRDFAAQHRIAGFDTGGRRVNFAESPITRLAAGERAYLEPHHLEAAERVRSLVERAHFARTSP